MRGHECYHCKQWVEEGEAHDCWTTTEAALTRDLPEDRLEAWQRLRETAVEFGDQRIYASHSSIMFAKKACYFFVRPKAKYLEVCIFLGRALKAPQVRTATPASKAKVANIVRIAHRDQVEAPITDWLREAYETSEALSAAARTAPKAMTRTAKKTKNAKQVKTPAPRSAAGSSASRKRESSASTRGSRAAAGAPRASRRRPADRPSSRAKDRRH